MILNSFPTHLSRREDEARAASIARGLRDAGWKVDTVGIYHADLYPVGEWGPLDIAISDPAVGRAALDDPLFADLHVARTAAADSRVVDQVRILLGRLRPDVVQVEQPWTWLTLRNALPPTRRPKVVYSCQNIEWKVRRSLLDLSLRRSSSDRSIESARLLETELIWEADLTTVVSETDGAWITEETGRSTAYVPPVSDMAEGSRPARTALTRDGDKIRCHYAAVMGSGYWPNVEGFFHIFPHGLGFLTQDQQIRAAGALGGILRADPRYQDFKSVNDVRLRVVGYLREAEKAAFFAAASCVIVPAHKGAGASQRMADALASGRPVITTSAAIDGCGPILRAVLDRGVYVADTPENFRDLMRRGLRDELTACPAEVQDRVSPARMAENLTPIYAGML